MYILLDKAKMLILHAHKSFEVVSNLARIECPDQAYDIFPLDHTARGFLDFTLTELNLLHRNCTGQEAVPNNDIWEVLALCWQHAHKLPETDVFPLELERQASTIPEDCAKQYRYVKGASRPACIVKLDEYRASITERSHVIASTVVAPVDKPQVRPAQPPRSISVPVSALTQQRPPSAAPAPAQRASTPRGGNKAIIWETADAMWKEAGEPVDKATVLALRKQMMDKLESEGVKRSSASSELGNWHKTRAPF